MTALVWRFGTARMTAATAPLGGGIGLRRSVVNLQVSPAYRGLDPAADLRAVAVRHRLADPVGLMTAADVKQVRSARAGAARAWATVGLNHPRSAVPAAAADAGRVGTINVVVLIDRRVSDAALLNLLTTATEAKCQALAEAGVLAENRLGAWATGTPTDALCVAAWADGAAEPFGGPLSPAGADVAAAVHRAVRASTEAPWSR